MSSLSADVVREAAIYLEYFLKGLSECNVVGSYAVQFLELRSLSTRLEASLANHLICLLMNMKGLLMKLDRSFIPFDDVGVQTEDLGMCSPQNRSYLNHPKEPFGDSPLIKPCKESPKTSQFFNSTSFIPIKQELHNLSDVLHMEKNTNSDRNLEVSDSGDPLTSDAQSDPEAKNEKCSITLTFPESLNEGVSVGYTSAQIDDEQGEILLNHLDGSDADNSEGLTYSIYAMDSSGSLQLVSKVSSKSGTVKDRLTEPDEKALIINKLKQEIQSQDPADELTLEESDASGLDDDDIYIENQEEFPCSSDGPICKSKPFTKVLPKTEKGRNVRQVRVVEEMRGSNPPVYELVKLGPEDVENGTWCNECCREFPTIGSLRAHIVQTHRKAKRCHTCSKVITSGDMSSHVKEYHRKLPYVCYVCGRSLKTNGALQRHLDIHKGLRGSACEVCGQTFSRTEYYQEHIRVHTGEKPYKCTTCKKAFARSSNLYKHMKIHNSKDQHHSCKLCMKAFAREDKLNEHMKRHLEVKKYFCRLCSKTYKERRDLIKHLNKVHPNSDSGCPD